MSRRSAVNATRRIVEIKAGSATHHFAVYDHAAAKPSRTAWLAVYKDRDGIEHRQRLSCRPRRRHRAIKHLRAQFTIVSIEPETQR